MTFDLAPAAAGFDSTRLDRVTDHLRRRYIDTGKIAGCQTLVARHGKVAHFSSLGQMDRERSVPMADDAIFRLFSMTKPITSVALMALYEQGHFQLNDPVSRFIPSWRDHQVWVSGDGADMKLEAPTRPMSMRDVLCHTGGLTYGSLLSSIGVETGAHPVDAEYERLKVRRDPNETLADMVAKLAHVPLRYQPGEQWMYSLSTDVCAYLVEVLSGQTFDAYLHEQVLGPLQMRDTAFSVAPGNVGRFAAGYGRNSRKELVLLDDPTTSAYLKKPAFFSGGGGLAGTISDYFRFTEMLRRGGELDGARILGPRTIAVMHRNHLGGGADLTQMAIGAFAETAYSGIGFGLGFASTIDQVASGSLGAGDYYWGGAASTIFWVDPIEDLVVVFMTQLVPSSTFDFRGQLKAIVYSSIVD